MKKVAQLLLLTFALGAVGYWVWDRVTAPSSPAEFAIVDESQPEPPAGTLQDQNSPVVVVTYFTTNARCESCRKIERLTQMAVDEEFTTEVKNGEVRFQTINLDEPQNRHFAQDYDLSFKTVVLSEETSDQVLRWQKLDQVWRLLHQPESFRAYVTQPIEEYLTRDS
ncbi:MAG: nitrophenyl compound nitroreductase subunit ArsF family protein [Puniceicoccales bacterium]